MRPLLVLLSCLLLMACSRGPDHASLQADLSTQLQRVFGEQLQLTELHRRGSATDTQAPSGTERLVVYYDAELKLAKKYDFSAWDSPGAASLLSTLGSGPRGIEGIISGGNQANDALQVHGSLIYQRQGDGWQAVVAQGFKQPQQTKTAANDNSPLVAAISTALNLAPGGSSRQTQAVIRDEVNRTLANIQARLSRQEHGYALASGAVFGQYNRFATALAALLKEKNIKLSPLLTEGGLDNLRMLREGKVQLAISQSDSAYQAVHGSGTFQDAGPNLNLRALASLYPEPLHVLVRADGPQSVTELRGKRVNLGPLSSASRSTAQAVLGAYGWQPNDFTETGELELPAALAALRDNQIDAVLQVIGTPADTISAASDALGLRLLALDPSIIAELQHSRPGTFAFSLAAGSYSRQTQAIPTLAVSSLLLSEQTLTSREAEQLVNVLFESGQQWLQLGSVQGTQLSASEEVRDLGIPLHEGAARALQQRRASTPEGQPGG
ncbi:MAG: TAXI family TRAP transporter solute-binding subunit [Pseudomonas sp.]|nr:TAXI family TRAP transporter solute-binding subunit [Pseudomonas sp.]